MKLSLLLPIVICLTLRALAQSAPTSLYAESFRQGPTHVIEEKFDVKLTPQDRTYRERIKNLHGDDRYLLSFVPQGPEGDTEITSWQVKLADLHHSMYENVLMSSQGPSSNPKDALWRLEPSTFARAPLTTKRIIKVDSFYVVLQVKAYHFTPPDSPYLDSMTVSVEFTDTDPRASGGTQK
ncbi:MAG: hypothetical protein WCC99_02705 [Candidatus Sulfotelmatobacter sp.]